MPTTPPAARPSVPDRVLERALQRSGYARVAGVDEVGRGPLAGPVVAAAVVLPVRSPHWVAALRDSKALTAGARERLASAIRAQCACGVGVVSAQVIDQIGIGHATRLAMVRAIDALPGAPPDALIIDGRERVAHAAEQRAVVGGDARCSAVAAASIVAKVVRDAMLCALDERFPGYGFARHKGYGTAEHLAALRGLGYSTAHRLSFRPVREALARTESNAR